MNHVILFTYILFIAGGTGGVVALALLHYRLRTRVTAAFLVANSGLFASLLLVLVTFYVDTILHVAAGSAERLPFELSVARTVLGYLFGVVVYGGMSYALVSLPAAGRSRGVRAVVWVTAGTAIGMMSVQTILIVSGRTETALALAGVYIGVISTCLLVYGTILVRHGGEADTPTMAWFLVRLGYLTVGFGVVSTVVYALLDHVPLLQSLDVSLDFLFYLLWCLLSIAAFVRYITRPAMTDGNGEIGPTFVRAFGITPREQEVIRLIGQGLTNQEIADRLHISFTTVRTHVYNIFQKTGAGNRLDLLRLAAGYRE